MEWKELQILVKVASSVLVTFTTEENLKRIADIRKNIEDMADDTVKFAEELLKDSTATAKIVEQIFYDVMITAGLDTPKISARGIEKETLKALRQEIKTQFELQRPVSDKNEIDKTTFD